MSSSSGYTSSALTSPANVVQYPCATQSVIGIPYPDPLHSTDNNVDLLPSQTEAASHLNDTRWTAVLLRDFESDHSFFYCVRSTRIYCRPSCPSRRPKRENVEFVLSPLEAVKKGYRPCRRCKPDELFGAAEQRQTTMVENVKMMIDMSHAEGRKVPKLEELGRAVGMSKCYLLRSFKKLVGQTPDQYAKTLK